MNSIASLDVDPEETVIVTPAGEDAFNLTPVTDAELIDALAQREADAKDEGEEEGFLDAIGLGPFHRKASLITLGGITAVANEFYVLNEETYVAACLFAGFTVMYVNLREPILEAYETYQQEALKAQTDAEEKHIAACRTLINAQRGSENLVDAVKEAFAEKEQLINAEAAARAIVERNKVAKDYDNRLQALVNRKSEEENKAYKVLLDNLYDDVLATVQSDAKFKKAALKYAILAMTDPKKARADGDPTVHLFKSKLEK